MIDETRSTHGMSNNATPDMAEQPQEAQDSVRETFAADRDELTQATQHFFRALFRTSTHVAQLPLSLLPPESQQHFKSAGRELTRGFTTLVKEMADQVERITEEGRK